MTDRGLSPTGRGWLHPILTSAVPLHGSAHNTELSKLEQELLAARRIEIDRGLGVLAHTFHFHHHATTEALMLNDASRVQA